MNRGYQPVQVISVRRAVTLLCKTQPCGAPVARVVDPTTYQMYTWEDWTALRPEADEDCLATPNTTLKVPVIIRLENHDRMKRHQRAAFNRRTVYRRDNDTCQYCGRQFPTEELSIDHVVPKCQGGQSTFENCVIACVSCNAKKAGRTPKQANMKLIRQPERPKAAVFEADIVCDSWSAFMDACYWAVPLID